MYPSIIHEYIAVAVASYKIEPVVSNDNRIRARREPNTLSNSIKHVAPSSIQSPPAPDVCLEEALLPVNYALRPQLVVLLAPYSKQRSSTEVNSGDKLGSSA